MQRRYSGKGVCGFSVVIEVVKAVDRSESLLSGYSGDHCQIMEPCKLKDVCLNGGTCIDTRKKYKNLNSEVFALFTSPLLMRKLIIMNNLPLSNHSLLFSHDRCSFANVLQPTLGDAVRPSCLQIVNPQSS